MEGLRDVARWLKTDIDSHCVILRGATSFSIGADLKDKEMHTSLIRPGATAEIAAGA